MWVADISQTRQPTPKQSIWINGISGKRGKCVFLILGWTLSAPIWQSQNRYWDYLTAYPGFSLWRLYKQYYRYANTIVLVNVVFLNVLPQHVHINLIRTENLKGTDPSPRCWCCVAHSTDVPAVSSSAGSWSELPESLASPDGTELKVGHRKTTYEMKHQHGPIQRYRHQVCMCVCVWVWLHGYR